ncbi:ImmA/IrrE family metallo-endopeptidase [Phytohabitans kaempferiae]|uniref:ImmA/IrrE family metallo-endopeptidase n=1 Tax=Phytohabitans kaempferiae TaxID=1620943 RepID=A0ABV6MF20_9ACTN
MYADIVEEDWPYTDCDAVVVGLLRERPTIFLRAKLHSRRQRFTLAHELGHIQMGWHIGVVGCNPDASQFEVEPLRPVVGTERVSSPRRLEEQEAEATRFASYLLIPDRFITPLLTQMDMPTILHGLDDTNVSTSAALMRLRRLLQPGFCFSFREGNERRVFTSSGTALPTMQGDFDFRAIAAIAEDHGRTRLAGRMVEWFRLSDFGRFEPSNDPRTATTLLRSAIADHEHDSAGQRSHFLSINGVVGGSLSVERAETPEQALSILRHKFKSKSQYGAISTHPNFDLYLRKKVEEWAQKRGLL